MKAYIDEDGVKRLPIYQHASGKLSFQIRVKKWNSEQQEFERYPKDLKDKNGNPSKRAGQLVWVPLEGIRSKAPWTEHFKWAMARVEEEIKKDPIVNSYLEEKKWYKRGIAKTCYLPKLRDGFNGSNNRIYRARVLKENKAKYLNRIRALKFLKEMNEKTSEEFQENSDSEFDEE